MCSKKSTTAVISALLISVVYSNCSIGNAVPMKKETYCNVVKDNADLGYVISGLQDVTQLSTEKVKLVKSKLVQNGVVVIKNQNLTRKQQVDFSKKLGKIVVLPKSFEGNDPDPNFPAIQRVTNYWSNGTWKGKTNCFGCYWHKDGNFQQNDYIASILYADNVAENRSTTLFLDNCKVFKQLSKKTKDHLSESVFTVSVRNIPDFAKSKDEDFALFPRVKRHKGIYRHPENGRTCAYITNTLITEQGYTPHLTDAWLEVTGKRGMYTHYWKKGDLVIWDNLAVMHRAGTKSFMGPGDRTPRMLYRTQVFI